MLTLNIETPGLTFDAGEHSYRLNGRPLPSVTTIINAVLPQWQAGDWYLQRGRALHHGCHLYDADVLDWDSVSPEIEPRIRAWGQFRRDFPAEVVLSEQPLANGVIGYAGTPDRVFRDSYGNNVLCDLKSTICPQVRLQLGAYAQMLALHKINIVRAVAVELRDDGTYRTEWLLPVDLERAYRVFQSCLTVSNFARAHNLNLKGDR